ncbi:MAG: hypothetical protein IJM90_04195 [Firmicutes bacterium]|nr:hypothetical protein [Bacillota bacterium]
MTDKMLEAIGAVYPLKERSAGEYENFAVNMMPFTVRCYEAEGLGNVSVMCGGVPGVMKMDTLIVNPFDRDMPLFSYDRIYAGGMDTLFLEMYDTCLTHHPDTEHLGQVVAEYADLENSPIEPNWYDDILYKESVKKVMPDELTARMDQLTLDYLAEYLHMTTLAPACERTAKLRAASAYTEGLLEHGGPSTDVFMKAKGEEFTQGLFRDVLFSTGRP